MKSSNLKIKTTIRHSQHTPIIDEPAAKVVRRIFELRATGITPTQIAKKLNAERVLFRLITGRRN